MEKLLLELMKSQDQLSDIRFSFKGEEYVFYYRYLTLLEKVRIEQMCVKRTHVINEDGSTSISYDKQEWANPIHTILEKVLDSKGKRLFSHTNPEHFKTISLLPAELATYIALEMAVDITGNLKEEANNGN